MGLLEHSSQTPYKVQAKLLDLQRLSDSHYASPVELLVVCICPFLRGIFLCM